MKDRIPLLAGLALLAIAIGVGSYAIANGIRDRGKNDVITVTGSAKQRITSDYIIWDVSVSSQRPTTARAFAELAGWTKRITAYLLSAGVKPSELTVQPISTSTVTAQDSNGGSSGQITGFQLTRTFELRSPRVAPIAAVAEHSSALLAEGIPLTADPPQYVYTKLSSLRPRLLTEATRDALNRAHTLVASTGAHLGHLREVNVGVFQVTSPNSTDVTDYGVYDTSTLQKDVTAVVNATFALR